MRNIDMKIAIIGAGNVGRALGDAWARKNHDVIYGVRDPDNAKHKTAGVGARTKSLKDAAAFAEVVVLATPWQATEAVCRELDGLKGKIVLDCTNPLAMGPEGLELALGFSQSGGERVQSWCPGASVFKTLNQVGFEVMAEASAWPERPVMFVAGDEAAAKPQVLGLVRDLGFEAVDAGPLKTARLLEPYAMLWITLAIKQGLPRNFAFRLIHPSS
jgi:predicted dinucleotide-binding enzyme